jgi:hypothetical protein
MIGAQMPPEISVIFNQLTWLIAMMLGKCVTFVKVIFYRMKNNKMAMQNFFYGDN